MTIDHELSRRINMMRILLISGIVFVHVPFDRSTSAYLGVNGVFDWIRVLLTDVVFRIGVPALSAISGLLLFRHGLETYSYVSTLKSKAKTVLLPLALWNGGLFFLVLTVQGFGIGDGFFPDVSAVNVTQFSNLLLAAKGMPIDLPLYFLRDLVMCILLSPLIGVCVARWPLITLVLLFFYAILPFGSDGIFLKHTIVFSFAVGAAVALHEFDLRKLDAIAPQMIALSLVLALLLLVLRYAFHGAMPPWLSTTQAIVTLTGGLGAWCLSHILLNTRFGQGLAKTPSGLSFWIFCAHYPLLIVLWMVWKKIGTQAYPAFYILGSLATFALLLASHTAVSRLAPGLYALLTGLRTKKGHGREEYPLSARSNY